MGRLPGYWSFKLETYIHVSLGEEKKSLYGGTGEYGEEISGSSLTIKWLCHLRLWSYKGPLIRRFAFGGVFGVDSQVHRNRNTFHIVHSGTGYIRTCLEFRFLIKICSSLINLFIQSFGLNLQ